MTKNIVGQYIKEKILPKGVTQAELAEKLGVTRQSVSRVLNRHSALSNEMAAKLCKAFNYDVDTLLKVRREAEETKMERATEQVRSFTSQYHAICSDDIEEYFSRKKIGRDEFPQFIRMLVRAENKSLIKCDFHAGDNSERTGWDGITEANENSVHVPKENAIWELGTNQDPRKKAEDDYNKSLSKKSKLNSVEYLPDTNKKHRDVALVLTSFFGAFRRSELVAIQVSDLVWEPEGLVIRLPRSKTDQQAAGLIRAIPYGAQSCCCPATAIKEWMENADICEGHLFRPVNRWDQVQTRPLNPGAVNDLLKTLGKACHFDFVPELSSHSFRRGLSTSAARERVDFELIKKQGGWKSDTTVWEYIEEGQQLTDNASVVLMKKMASLMSIE